MSEYEQDQEQRAPAPAIQFDISGSRAIREIHNDLMFIALGVSCILVMLWAINKRLDEFEVLLKP